MPPRGSAACCLFLVVIVACAVTTGDTRAPPGEGCPLQPADRRVGMNVDCSDLRFGYIPNDLPTGMLLTELLLDLCQTVFAYFWLFESNWISNNIQYFIFP